jgi:serine/threonine protein kinase
MKKKRQRRTSSMLSARVGTPFYLSPEQLDEKGYDEKVDIYSLGLILFELVNQFATQHHRKHCHELLREKHQLTSSIEDEMPQETALIKHLTARNPRDRPTAVSILKHSSFKRWKQEVNGPDL